MFGKELLKALKDSLLGSLDQGMVLADIFTACTPSCS
jgi:hypothetical protein